MEDNLKLQWSELADTLGQTGLDILAGAPVTVTEKRFAEPKVLAIMLMSRTLSNFSRVFTLIELGLLVEARVLVRCCFENTFWMAELHSQGDKFVRKMLHDEMRSRQVRGEMVLSKKPQLLEDVEKRLRDQLRAINKNGRMQNPLARRMSYSAVCLGTAISSTASYPPMRRIQR